MPSTRPPKVPPAGAEPETPLEQRTPTPEAMAHALASVARIVSGITAALDLPATLQAALDAVREILAADIGAIRLLQDPPGELVLAASAGLTGEESAGLSPRVPADGESLSAQVARAKAPICLGQMDAAGPPMPAARWRLGLASVLGVPLVVRDRLVGTLLVGARRPHAFGSDAARLAEAIAQVVAPALDRAALLDEVERLYAGTLRAKVRADALAEIGRALASARELDAVLDVIADKTLAATECEACGIYRWDAAEAVLRPVAVRGLSQGFRREFALARGEGVSGLVLRGGEPAWTSDVLADPRFRLNPRTRELVAAEGFRSVLVVPIPLKAEFFGTLVTYRWRPHEFTEEEVRFQAALADQAAVAIDNARLFEGQREAARNAEREKARAEALAAVGQAISASLDLDEVLTLLVERTAAATGADAASVLQRDPATGVVRFRRAHGLSTEFWKALALPPGAGIVGAALATGQPQWTPDIQADARFPLPDDVRALNAAEGLRGILSAPVRGSDGPYGVLNLYRRDRHAFDEEEVAFAIRIAEQAGLAIENARLYQEERSRSQDLAALIRAGRAASSSLDLPRILETIVASAAELTGASVAYLQLVEEGGPLVLRASAGPLHQTFADTVYLAPVPVGESFSGGVTARGESLWVPDITADPRQIYREFNLRHGIRCYLGVPILAGARVLGVLSVIAPEGKLSEGRRPVLETLAGQAAIAIENARLFGETREALEELSAIHEASRAITQSLNLEETLQRILAAAMRLTGMDKGIIWLLDEERRELAGTVVVGLPGELVVRLPLSDASLAAASLQEGRTLISESPETDPRVNPAVQARFGNKALIAVPLRSGPRAIGVLDLGDLKRPRRFTPRELAILERLAQQAVVAIENARLYEQALKTAEEIAALYEASQAITESLDLETTLGRIAESAGLLAGADRTFVWLSDPREGGLRAGIASGGGAESFLGTRLPADSPAAAARAVREARPLAIANALDPASADPALSARFGNAALLAIPLRVQAAILGVLVCGYNAPRTFGVAEVDRLMGLAQQAALAIQNARLFAETRKAYEDLQAAQEQLVQVEKLRALGEMAGGVAHDFNNLLAAILGRAQLLRLRSADPQVRDGLAIIEGAALDGAETVRRILGFARVRPEAQYAPVDLAALMPQALEVTRPRWKDEAQARGAAIEAVLAVESVPPVLGNAAELREVIVNLVFNAVDAMPDGGRLTVGARRLLRPARAGGAVNPRRETLADEATASQELVEVFVRDTGVGMSDAVRRRAFEPFFTTKGVKGSGLGLSVVYGIVSRHGGEVLLESQEGVGTTVTLRLPATDKPAADLGTPALPPAARVARIVVVDDEEVLAEALADLLRLQRHHVHAFTDPRRAMEHLAREPADLLFTDLGMSEMSGWDVARRARELHPALPVVLVTGWGHAIDPAQVRERRVNAVVAKPFRVEDILHVVAELLPARPAG